MAGKLYGLVAAYNTTEDILTAAAQTRKAGYTSTDAFTPFPVEGLDEALRIHDHRVSLLALLGGISGGATGWIMQHYSSTVDYPVHVAGKPFFSWPAFVPVTFELTILFSALAAAIGMLWLNGLPAIAHPVFSLEGFSRASSDRYFLCIQARDPKFSTQATRQFLEGTGAAWVKEVHA